MDGSRGSDEVADMLEHHQSFSGTLPTTERDEEGAREQRGKEKPCLQWRRLGRASPPLSVWLGAAAPEEIKKHPGVVVVEVVVRWDKLCLGSENKREKVIRNGRKLGFIESFGNEKTKQGIVFL